MNTLINLPIREKTPVGKENIVLRSPAIQAPGNTPENHCPFTYTTPRLQTLQGSWADLRYNPSLLQCDRRAIEGV